MKRMNVWWSAVAGVILVAGVWVTVGASQTASKASYKRLSGPQTKKPRRVAVSRRL